MKTKFYFLGLLLMPLAFFGQNPFGLNPAELQQAKIQAQGILDANRQARLDKAALPAPIVGRGVNDTIVEVAHYDNDDNVFFTNVEHISYEVKDGVMYAKFKGDVTKAFQETHYILNYQLTPIAPPALNRKVTAGSNKIIVYATPATKGKFLSTSKWGWSVGLLSVPFKIRGRSNGLPPEAKGDIKNVNLFFGRSRVTDRIFWNNRTSSHRWIPYSLLLGFSSETLTDVNTGNADFKDKPTNQAYLTTGVGIGYSYKEKINIMIIPAGFDFGFSQASTQWYYNKKYWFGFGIGLDFSNVFNF